MKMSKAEILRKDDRFLNPEEKRQEGLSSCDLPVTTFDLAVENRRGILGFLNKHLPSTLTKELTSQIAVVAKHRSEDVLGRLDGQAYKAKMIRAHEEWTKLMNEDGLKIDHVEVRKLAKKVGITGGKWLFLYSANTNSNNNNNNGDKGRGRGFDLDAEWKKIAWNFAYEKFTKNCLFIKLSKFANGTHKIAFWTPDIFDDEGILAVEKALRKNGAFKAAVYKPDVYSAIGIYRGNSFGLRPSLFSSKMDCAFKKHRDQEQGHGGENKSLVESSVDPGWNYVVKLDKALEVDVAKEGETNNNNNNNNEEKNNKKEAKIEENNEE